jgi:hypothetical protein
VVLLADVEKARASRNLRRGKGKMRNRRYVTRKGPLVVYGENSGIVRAFRNIPGVDLQSVDSLNLLQVWLLSDLACCPDPPTPSVMLQGFAALGCFCCFVDFVVPWAAP